MFNKVGMNQRKRVTYSYNEIFKIKNFNYMGNAFHKPIKKSNINRLSIGLNCLNCIPLRRKKSSKYY
jgi:hypothetical protein